MVSIRGLSMSLKGFQIGEIDLDIYEGEYFGLLGSTGAGKTLLIKCIAGIRAPDKGKILVNGTDIVSLPPEKRRIGFVPQDYRLFPHLTVEENIEFGLRSRNSSNSKDSVKDLMELVGVSHISKRQCTNCLSGGEKQKVALARALATNPKLLLLDEPLGSLDTQTNKRLRSELKKIHDQIGTTTIHITHNFEEALDLTDRIAIMNNGKIIQVGKPTQVLEKPNSNFIEEFVKIRT